jgi:hypothetical protein
LAGEVPADKDVAPGELALFPPGATPASLRRLCAVAAEAAGPRADAGDLALLRRATELQNSTYRLDQLAKDQRARKELDGAEARKWRDALAAGVRAEQARVVGCRSAVIRGHVEETLRELDADLGQLAATLGQ